MRQWLLAGVLSCALAACGGKDEGTIDSGVVHLDAKPGGEDAAPGGADARPVDAGAIDARPVTIDAPPVSIDAAQPDAVVPTPDARQPDATPPMPDAHPGPDACVSDPRCNGPTGVAAAGMHCDGSGELVTCGLSADGCFNVTNGPNLCPTGQTCPDGKSACECVGDDKCTAGEGTYCDPAGSGKFFRCTKVNGCAVSGVEMTCTDPEICTGAAGFGSCACAALGDKEGEGCTNPSPQHLSCDPDTGNVLQCTSVGTASCPLWVIQGGAGGVGDCQHFALTCSNNQCNCPRNDSHNFYVGPNYDRTLPTGLVVSPNGLLTSTGVCTFPTLTDGVIAATNDVVNLATLAQVIAIAEPLSTAVFDQEPDTIVIPNRVQVITNDDPAAGGSGLDDSHYTLLFNYNASTAVQLTQGPRTGGSRGAFKGFTIEATQDNIDNNSAATAIACDFGPVSIDTVHLLGGGVATKAAAPPPQPLITGLAVTDACWGNFDRMVIEGFGNVDFPGQGVGVDAPNQGTNQAGTDANAAVFSHLNLLGDWFGLRQTAGYVVLDDNDPTLSSNLIDGTTSDPTVSATDIGLLFEDSGELMSFTANDLYIIHAGSDGVDLENGFVVPKAPAPVVDGSTVELNDGKISGTIAGNGILQTAGGLSLAGTEVSGNAGDGIRVDGGAFASSGALIQNNLGSGVHQTDGTVTVNGGKVTKNGTLVLDDTANGGGVAMTGGNLVVKNAEVSANGLSGIATSGAGTAALTDVNITGNGEDRTPTNLTSAAKAVALFVGNTGGFTMTGGTVNNNHGGGVMVLAASVDTGATPTAPMQVFDGVAVNTNGGFTTRDVAGGTTTGFQVNGAAAIGGASVIMNNAGVGLLVNGYLIGGDVTVDGNGGNDGVTKVSGVVIGAAGRAIVTGTAASRVLIERSGKNGIDLLGSLTGDNLRLTGNLGAGVLVNSNLFAGMDINGDPMVNSTLNDIEIDHNGGDGITILQALPFECAAAAACTVPGFGVLGNRPTVASTTTIHDNTGNGATMGSQTAQSGDISAQIADADISVNTIGIKVAEPLSPGTAVTVSDIRDVDIFRNRVNGLLIQPSSTGSHQSVLTPAPFPNFVDNKVFGNTMNQVVFDGGLPGTAQVGHNMFTIDSPSNSCNLGANAIYCYKESASFGVFGQHGAIVNVNHTQWESAQPGTSDFKFDAASNVTVSTPCTPISVCTQ